MTLFNLTLKKNASKKVNLYPGTAPGERSCEIPFCGTLRMKEGTNPHYKTEWEVLDYEGYPAFTFEVGEVVCTTIATGSDVLNIALKYRSN